jgi:anti-sigma factor RsiW
MNYDDDTLRRLSVYQDGELSAEEAAEFERILATDPDLRQVASEFDRLAEIVRDELWITPSPAFTLRVVEAVESSMDSPLPAKVRRWEKAKGYLSVAAMLLVLVLHGGLLAGWFIRLLAQSGAWLGGVTGIPLFALHPVIILGLIAPVLAGGYATCVLTGRCRLNP